MDEATKARLVAQPWLFVLTRDNLICNSGDSEVDGGQGNTVS